MEFNGFEHLTANYLYCPNQFFEVCLPNHSRGTVRLVAFMLRKTLGWLDKEGNPIEQNISISYRDLIDEAGISRGAIRKALDEAVAGGFNICIQKGQANKNNQTADPANNLALPPALTPALRCGCNTHPLAIGNRPHGTWRSQVTHLNR